MAAHSTLNSSRSQQVNPKLVVQDPVTLFDSWKGAGYHGIQGLINIYRVNLQPLFDQGDDESGQYVVYEKLRQDQQKELGSLLTFKLLFSHPSWTSGDGFEAGISCGEVAGRSNIFLMVHSVDSALENITYRNHLSRHEIDLIEENIGDMYVSCWEDSVTRLRTVLLEKTWFAFDLDDTLHEFRKASRVAADTALKAIGQRYGAPFDELRCQYNSTLKTKTSHAFADGKTSHEYRRDRLSSVLSNFSLAQDNAFMDEVLSTYEKTMMASLELKSGASRLLDTVKALGKKIVVITEGPQDAQERTVKGLGIEDRIDFLATTNHFRVSKSDGLFPKVLDHLGILPHEMVYVGDSEQRDMIPAMAEGIFSVHYAENDHVALDLHPPKVNTLWKLQHILAG